MSRHGNFPYHKSLGLLFIGVSIIGHLDFRASHYCNIFNWSVLSFSIIKQITVDFLMTWMVKDKMCLLVPSMQSWGGPGNLALWGSSWGYTCVGLEGSTMWLPCFAKGGRWDYRIIHFCHVEDPDHSPPFLLEPAYVC